MRFCPTRDSFEILPLNGSASVVPTMDNTTKIEIYKNAVNENNINIIQILEEDITVQQYMNGTSLNELTNEEQQEVDEILKLVLEHQKQKSLKKKLKLK